MHQRRAGAAAAAGGEELRGVEPPPSGLQPPPSHESRRRPKQAAGSEPGEMHGLCHWAPANRRATGHVGTQKNELHSFQRGSSSLASRVFVSSAGADTRRPQSPPHNSAASFRRRRRRFRGAAAHCQGAAHAGFRRTGGASSVMQRRDRELSSPTPNAHLVQFERLMKGALERAGSRLWTGYADRPDDRRPGRENPPGPHSEAQGPCTALYDGPAPGRLLLIGPKAEPHSLPRVRRRA